MTGTPTPGLPADSRSCFLQNICDEDILSQVFDHLQEDKRTLAVAARAHRLFTELALDKLWKSLDSLFPLFKILPAFQESDGTYVLRGTVTPHDWDRFNWYARRVRVFCYTRDLAAIDIAMHVYFRVAQLRSSPLLPELQCLVCPSLSQSDILIPAICLFLSPSLQSIQFGEITNIEDKLVGTFLHTLITEGAELENITLKGDRDALSKDSLSFITHFRHLKKLDLSGMGNSLYPELLQGLGSLAYLEQLDIDFRHCPLRSLEDEIGMSSLKRLTIQAPTFWVAIFLSKINLGCQLNTLQIYSHSTSDPSREVDIRSVLEDIAARWRTSLRKISIIEDNDEVLLTSSVAPLLSLRELRYVCLEGYMMDLSDEDIKVFAYSWPKLQCLLLPFAPVGFPRPSIQSFYELAVHCPQLEELRIPIDTGITVQPLSDEEERELGRDRHRLKILTLASGDDPLNVRDLLQLARYVDSIFPHIQSVKTFPDDDDDIWNNIKHMISTFQSVRSEAIFRTIQNARH